MSDYLYPVRLSPQIVYPDVQPNIAQPASALERSFKAEPAICELIVQQIIDGKLPADSPFVAVLPGSLRPDYNSEALDRRVYEFKQLLDPLLIAGGHLRYEVPELSGILASEIAFVEREGLPLGKIPEEERAASMVRIMDTFLAGGVAAGLSGYDRGLGVAAEIASAAAGSIKPEIIKGNPFVSDLLIQSLSIVSPFINLAFQMMLSVVSTVAAVVQAAASGAPLAAAFASGVAALGQTIASSAGAAIAAFSAAASATVAGLALSMFLFVASNLIMDMVMEYRQWAKYTRELRRQRESIRETFRTALLDVEAEIETQKTKARENLTQFRLMLAEMVARTVRGEVLIGLVERTSDGRWILTYSVDPDFIYTDTGAEVAASGAQSFLPYAVVALAAAIRFVR